METKTFYKLSTLIEMYDIEFYGNCSVKSKKENKCGTIYNSGGYGIESEKVNEFMERPFTIHNADIGYFDLHEASGWVEAFERYGYNVVIK